MKINVVYESLFGNTAAVARAIGEACGTNNQVAVLSVDEALNALPFDADLLIVGAPTHAFGMTRVFTRMGASEEARKLGHKPTQGVRTLLKALPSVTQDDAAAFDTRIDKSWAGSAARGIARAMRRKGYRLAAEPEHFNVAAVQGPLAEGEIEHASEWARRVVGQMNTSD
ncbi:MAG: flavodoxin [Vicinamibacteria bacterium]|nr:flavodoxin [Vicinamibacteria bacterium]